MTTNLYRSDTTGIYYAIFKRGGKQYHHSLRTMDRQIAERRLSDKRARDCPVDATGRAQPVFAENDDNGVPIGGAAK